MYSNNYDKVTRYLLHLEAVIPGVLQTIKELDITDLGLRVEPNELSPQLQWLFDFLALFPGLEKLTLTELNAMNWTSVASSAVFDQWHQQFHARISKFRNERKMSTSEHGFQLITRFRHKCRPHSNPSFYCNHKFCVLKRHFAGRWMIRYKEVRASDYTRMT
jgi:hypothetical protein